MHERQQLEKEQLTNAFNAERGKDALRSAKDYYLDVDTDAGGAEPGAPFEEYSLNTLKEELNKVVWMFAAEQTTLKEADALACRMLEMIVRNRENHNQFGRMDGASETRSA